jgi:hypothetical protein
MKRMKNMKGFGTGPVDFSCFMPAAIYAGPKRSEFDRKT